jgi:hypothetical protein
VRALPAVLLGAAAAGYVVSSLVVAPLVRAAVAELSRAFAHLPF